MRIAQIILAASLLLAAFMLVGCDPVEHYNRSYRYTVDGSGFITMIIEGEEDDFYSETSISVIHIISIETFTTVNENKYLRIKMSNGSLYDLYEINTKDFLALVSEALGPWVMGYPAPIGD